MTLKNAKNTVDAEAPASYKTAIAAEYKNSQNNGCAFPTGGIQIHTSSLYIEGYTTFTRNSAGEDGGEIDNRF